jgi:hypothetical protein
MKDFDIKQIDYLREKAGITYEESIALLERFDGDLARCIVDLERNGRLKPNKQGAQHGGYGSYQTSYGESGPARQEQRAHRPAFVLDGEGAKNILFSRVLVRKGDMVISNLTVLFMLFVLIFAPWVAVAAVIAAFTTGCHVKWMKGGRAPSSASVQQFMDQATENIRRTADSVMAAVKQPPQAEDKPAERPAEQFTEQPAPSQDDQNSDANPNG